MSHILEDDDGRRNERAVKVGVIRETAWLVKLGGICGLSMVLMLGGVRMGQRAGLGCGEQ